MDQSPTIASVAESTAPQPAPPQPSKIPSAPVEGNIPKLKQFLLDQFASITFNRNGLFPTMDAKPAHLHIKPDAKPFVRHTPIPIPFYLTEAVKKSLDDDVL